MAAPHQVNYCPRCGSALELTMRFGQERPCCPDCGYVHFYDPKVAAAVFITNGAPGAQRVLLIQRGVQPEIGKWALPAGFVDAHEDPRHTASREVREETGLDVRITDLLDVFHSSHQPGASIIIVYAAEVLGGKLQPLDDAEAVAWFSPDDLPDLAFESTHRLIRTWVEGQPAR